MNQEMWKEQRNSLIFFVFTKQDTNGKYNTLSLGSQESFMCIAWECPVKFYCDVMQHTQFSSMKQISEIQDSSVVLEKDESTPTKNPTGCRDDETHTYQVAKY